jgi:ribosome maturation factor RimP
MNLRGPGVPSIFVRMINKKHIEDLALRAMEGTKMFVVKLNVGGNNKISLIIDGDDGVTIKDCVDVSRGIEHNLDRETEDFELNVYSFGIGQDFVNLRQYKKNISKPVEIQLVDGSTKRGVLSSVTDEMLVLQEEVTKKNKKSKKMLLGEDVEIAMTDIKSTKCVVVF